MIGTYKKTSKQVFFSKRIEIADKAIQWCLKNQVQTNPFNIVTALCELEYIKKEIPAESLDAPADEKRCRKCKSSEKPVYFNFCDDCADELVKKWRADNVKQFKKAFTDKTSIFGDMTDARDLI